MLGSAALVSDRTEFRVALYEVMHLLVVTPLMSVPRVEHMIAALPTGAATGSTGWEIVTVSVCTVLVLTAVTTISVFKPWGRTH